MRAAAGGLFKLMAYKDEFEVARLLTDRTFTQRLQAQFEGKYSLRYHLAPPLLSRGRDAQGRVRKRAYGPWMGWVMGRLAHLKWLRGTPFNPFGYHAEARLHRELLAWYETGLKRAAELCAQGRADDALTFLGTPDDIRGYGPIRARAARQVRELAGAALA